MKKVLYVGQFNLPETASGLRVYNIAKVMRKCGMEVSFGCFYNNKGLSYERYDDFDYFFKPVCDGSLKVLNIFDLYSDIMKIYFVKKLLHKIKPDVIVLYNSTSIVTKYLQRFSKKNDICLIADVTEWYEISLANKRDKIVAKSVDYRIKNLDKNMDAIISISPFLTNYYNNLNTKVIEIPPIMYQISGKPYEHYQYEDRSRCNIVYAGSPGRKDQLDGVVKAISEINRESILIHLDIVGVSKEEYREKGNHIGNGISMYGRLSHEETIEIIKRADFSVLFRENLRYAKAGFSTKFAESLSLGVPVICNQVGGCDQLIKSHENGILLPNGDYETIKEALGKILLLSPEEIYGMKENAINTAKSFFSKEVNQKKIKELVDYLFDKKETYDQ